MWRGWGGAFPFEGTKAHLAPGRTFGLFHEGLGVPQNWDPSGPFGFFLLAAIKRAFVFPPNNPRRTTRPLGFCFWPPAEICGGESCARYLQVKSKASGTKWIVGKDRWIWGRGVGGRVWGGGGGWRSLGGSEGEIWGVGGGGGGVGFGGRHPVFLSRLELLDFRHFLGLDHF